MALINYSYTPHLLFSSKTLHETIKKNIIPCRLKEQEISLGTTYKNEIISAHTENLYVKYLGPLIGRGVFATEEIKKNAFVGCYVGVVEPYDPYLDFNDYLYKYPLICETQPLIINAKNYGNITRFINHSFSPNLSKHYAYCNHVFHVIFLANRIIEKDEQLFYDYGKSYWNLRGLPLNL